MILTEYLAKVATNVRGPVFVEMVQFVLCFVDAEFDIYSMGKCTENKKLKRLTLATLIEQVYFSSRIYRSFCF